MKIPLLFLTLAFLPLHAERPPNIVLILGDDQAWTDFGFMGHPELHTPALDQLAERSLVFERGYVASPLCRPSLASIATGRFPQHHGITGNDVDGRNDREELDLPVRQTFHQIPSFIRLLTQNGYLAHQSGKWWEGTHLDGGFTHGLMPTPNRHGSPTSLAIGRDGMSPVTDFIDLALAEEKPFFVWYAPFLPHTPHNPPERLLKKYQSPERADDVAKYYAMCEWFDETCATLVAHLEKRNLTENTLIIFIGDNGWAAPSTNQDDPDQAAWTHFALRSKGSPFENGIRSPILISWPSQITPARSPHFAHAIDLFPTIAAAAQLTPKSPTDLPGLNLLDPEAPKKRDTIFGVTHSIHNMTPGIPDDTLQYLWCLEDEWKLILRYSGQDTTTYRRVHAWDKVPTRLYRIKDDPHETTNLADKHPEIVARLREKILQWHRPVTQ